MTAYVVAAHRSYPVAPEVAFDAVLPAPLERIFARGHGPIPPIAGTADQQGVWGSVGRTRTVRLARGGGTMREELTSLERPGSFGYHLTRLTGPLSPLVREVHGRWSFDAVGTGTRITWEWRIEPTTGLAAPLLPVLGRFWRGYARNGFDAIEQLLLP